MNKSDETLITDLRHIADRLRQLEAGEICARASASAEAYARAAAMIDHTLDRHAAGAKDRRLPG